MQEINWNYISEKGLPKLKDNKPHAYLICYRVELGQRIQIGSMVDVLPTGKFIESCTVALIQKKASKDGFAYTPAKKFYWGGDIYDTAYAWAEFPKAIPVK